MFLSTYKNTVKTILRSGLFWITFAVLILIAAPSLSGFVTYAVGHEPTSLSVSHYIEHLKNIISSSFLVYAMPLFSVVVTVLVLNRDYGDQFFEIEKAANVRPVQYLLGRMCAILSILLVVQMFSADVLLHIYVAGWGGVDGLPLGTYLLDSTIRLLRMVFGLALPCMLFYVSLTYMVGALFHSGLIGALGGFGCVILYRVLLINKVMWLMRGNALAELYFGYLCHIPDKLQRYLFYFDVEDGQNIMVWFDTSIGKALLCFCILIGYFAVFTAVSFWRVQKRET